MEQRSFGTFTDALPAAFRQGDPAAGMKTREEAHLRAVQHLFEALERADLDAFLGLMHPAVEFEMVAPPKFDWRLSARGQAELRALVEHNFSTIRDQNPEILNVVAQGNNLVLLARERGRLRQSGDAYEAHVTFEFTFSEGKITRIRELVASST